RADHHGDPRHLVLVQLALSRVDAGANIQSQLAHAFNHLLGTADRPRRSVESGEEAVARGVPLLAAKPKQGAANDGVVALQQLAPAAVSELGSPLRRAD